MNDLLGEEKDKEKHEKYNKNIKILNLIATKKDYKDYYSSVNHELKLIYSVTK